MPWVGVVSAPFTMLLRAGLRLGRSSTLGAFARAVSISTRPWTVIGTTAASAVVDAGVFVMRGGFCAFRSRGFWAGVAAIEDALEDCGGVVCDSGGGTPVAEKVDVGASDEVAVSRVEVVPPLSPRGSDADFGTGAAAAAGTLLEEPSR
jgi:hypothetical protein